MVSRVAAARIFAFLVSLVTVAIILVTGHRAQQPGDAPSPTQAQGRNKRLSTDAQHSDPKNFCVFLYSIISLKLWKIESVPQFVGKEFVTLQQKESGKL